MKRLMSLLLLSFLMLPSFASAITLGQLDDFENGTVMGWDEGVVSPNPPQNIASGGPAGAGDNYLQNVSSGQLGEGGKMVMFNQVQWTGNYVTAGVTAIQAQVANFGATELHLRIAFSGANTEFGSVASFDLAPGSGWQTATFGLGAADLQRIIGAATLNTALSSVTTLRILSAEAGASWQGDQVAGTLGVDNIRAIDGTSAAGDPGIAVVRLLQNAPNPLRSHTIIRYELARPSPVRITIFDLAGRVVRRLEETGVRTAGSHQVAWDGFLDDGSPARSGMYFYRIETGSFTATRKMLVVRD